MDRAILQERAGRGSRPKAECVADKLCMSLITNDAVELLAQTALVTLSAPTACYTARHTLAAHLTRIVELTEVELSRAIQRSAIAARGASRRRGLEPR
jgi:hypothetical protein